MNFLNKILPKNRFRFITAGILLIILLHPILQIPAAHATCELVGDVFVGDTCQTDQGVPNGQIAGGGNLLGKIANVLTGIGASPITLTILTLSVIVNGIFVGIISFELWLVQVALNPATWGTFTTNPFIVAGWGMVRNLANMGFVIAIVAIAIGFILRIQSYGNTKTLWRLIIAAILVNFSLVIAGIFIDTGNTITQFFLNSPVFGGDIANPVTTFLGIRNLLGSNQTVWNNILTIGRTITDFSFAIKLVISSVFTSMFLLIAIIVIGAVGVMLIIRVFYLFFLLIMAPLAYVASIFPGTERLWKEWWHNFIRWTFFGPAMTFFIYLAFLLERTAKYSQAVTDKWTAGFNGTKLDPASLGLASTTTPGNFVAFMVPIGLLIGGLIVANKMGIEFAGAAQKLATNVVTYPGRAARGVAQSGYKAASREAGITARRARAPISEALGLRLVKTGVVGDILGLKAAGRAMIAGGVRDKKELDKIRSDTAALATRVNSETLEALYVGAKKPEEKIAFGEEKIERGLEVVDADLKSLAKLSFDRRYTDALQKFISTKPYTFAKDEDFSRSIDIISRAAAGASPAEHAQSRLEQYVKKIDVANIEENEWKKHPELIQAVDTVRGFGAFNKLAQEKGNQYLKTIADEINANNIQFKSLYIQLKKQPAWKKAGIT